LIGNRSGSKLGKPGLAPGFFVHSGLLPQSHNRELPTMARLTSAYVDTIQIGLRDGFHQRDLVLRARDKFAVKLLLLSATK
jgi:hypothetical protein